MILYFDLRASQVQWIKPLNFWNKRRLNGFTNICMSNWRIFIITPLVRIVATMSSCITKLSFIASLTILTQKINKISVLISKAPLSMAQLKMKMILLSFYSLALLLLSIKTLADYIKKESKHVNIFWEKEENNNIKNWMNFNLK